MRTYRMCRQLQLIDSLHDLLQKDNDKAQTLLSKLAEEADQFQEVFEPLPVRGNSGRFEIEYVSNTKKSYSYMLNLIIFIIASTKFQLKLADPDFTQYKATDLFKALVSTICQKMFLLFLSSRKCYKW